jgi:hypothetical protein
MVCAVLLLLLLLLLQVHVLCAAGLLYYRPDAVAGRRCGSWLRQSLQKL